MTNWKVIEGAIKVLEVEEVAVDSSEYARREETKSGATNLGLAALKLVSGEPITTYSTSRAPSEVCYDRYWFEVGGFKLYFDLLVTDQARKPPLPREFSTATRARAIAAEEGGLLRAAAIILPEEDVFFWCSYSKAGRGALLRRYLRGIGCIGLVWATLLAMSGGALAAHVIRRGRMGVVGSFLRCGFSPDYCWCRLDALGRLAVYSRDRGSPENRWLSSSQFCLSG